MTPYQKLMAAEEPHPLLELPSEAEVALMLAAPANRTKGGNGTNNGAGLAGPERLAKMLEVRRAAIANANRDPVRHELEPDHWRIADGKVKPGRRLVAALGGNRAGKSWWAGKRTVQTLLRHKGATIVALAEDEQASIMTQQPIIWHYLPPEIKALRGKRDAVFKVAYTVANGFSDRTLVLPNGSILKFATYQESPDDYEGIRMGPVQADWEHPAWNVAWWADENLRLGFLQMLRRRTKFAQGFGVWSFTPIRGMTPTIKEVVGTTRITATRKAELLPDRVNVAGCPPGTMPLTSESEDGESAVVYFHTELSPFGPGPNGSGERFFEAVRRECINKPSDYTMKIAYGYTRESAGRAFPKFSKDVHVVRECDLPAEGTNYRFIDPAGGRSFFVLWVRVAPGNPSRLFIYRDWPDCQRYGEWAVPSEKELSEDGHKGWDGIRGPAQVTKGFGVSEYKKTIWGREEIAFGLTAAGDWAERDPYRRRLLDEAMRNGGAVKNGDRWDQEDVSKIAMEAKVSEKLRRSKVDPRAGASPQASERGGMTLIDLFARSDSDDKGRLVAGPMLLEAAYTGRGIDDGISHINELLSYDESQPVVPFLNEPRLYVSERCQQVIWALNNYTGRGGEEGGCKDVIDLIRYMAQDDDLRHIAGGKLKVGGFTGGPV